MTCHSSFQVPLVASGKVIPAAVWEFSGTAYDQGDEAADWITKYLGERHRLVRYAGETSTGTSCNANGARSTNPWCPLDSLYYTPVRAKAALLNILVVCLPLHALEYPKSKI